MHALNGNGNDPKQSDMDQIPIMDGYWLITVEGLPDLANQETPFWYNPKPVGSTEAPSESWESLIKRCKLKDKYYNLDDGAKGAIKQRLTNAIIEEIKDLSSAKEVWKYLETKYNKAGSAQVFGDIQKVYNDSQDKWQW
ncbi:hypothetical protein AMATHDRAFT_7496 [Amanita thiersii Skay4041]|uniref:Uncharacterized protein n=1 Tax=Amanita thiersii Skay4041 TaxID=703135 RepID=A0A2A9NG48_9AGAR|nr:hypothetical protein AMATHDRAFT_7496 [Amanita thiersii Skay4041]